MQPKMKHVHIKLKQRLKASIFCPLNYRLDSKVERHLNLKHAGSQFKIHGVYLFFVYSHCQSASLKALCEATKSGLQLLSTSVLPFPSFFLSLSLSLVITVKVQLQRLPWELSQRCVTAMWCFTHSATRPSFVIHTCGINETTSLHANTDMHTDTHTCAKNHMVLSSSTCGHVISPSGSFLFDQTLKKSIQVFLFLAIQEQFL